MQNKGVLKIEARKLNKKNREKYTLFSFFYYRNEPVSSTRPRFFSNLTERLKINPRQIHKSKIAVYKYVKSAPFRKIEPNPSNPQTRLFLLAT